MLRSEYGAFLSCIVAITLNAGRMFPRFSARDSVRRSRSDRSLPRTGRELGKNHAWVILPQAFRRILPPLGNNAIAIVKDSSTASAIDLADGIYPRGQYPARMQLYWGAVHGHLRYLLDADIPAGAAGSIHRKKVEQKIHVNNLQKNSAIPMCCAVSAAISVRRRLSV